MSQKIPETDLRKLLVMVSHDIKLESQTPDTRKGMQTLLMREIEALQKKNPQSRVPLETITEIAEEIAGQQREDLIEFSEILFRRSLNGNQKYIEDQELLAEIFERRPDIHPEIDFSERCLYTMESALQGHVIVSREWNQPYPACFRVADRKTLERHAEYMRSIRLPGQWTISKNTRTQWGSHNDPLRPEEDIRELLGEQEGDLEFSDLESITYRGENPPKIYFVRTPVLVFQLHRDLFQGYDRELMERYARENEEIKKRQEAEASENLAA